MTVFIRVALMLVLLAAAHPGYARTLKVGDVAPDFEMTLVDGSKVQMSDLRGQVIVINFWATWCGPCKRELPLLDAYYRVRQPNGLRVFAVTTEDSVPISQLKPLFAKLSIPAARRIKGPYAVLGALPTNFVIDRAGVIRYAQASAFDLDALNTTLVPLLRQPAP